ncbi:malonyl-ACP O-methyltransferase BioC [Klebsiella sp. BIGb0407]|uniref:malonyl-ACP O-methyltransferase BioC n=1 Tax=Klebsiella sp. BIGb0407 TaxID=2940603 RepID=UPI0021685EAF|nr:malonyl-ACP O-methyltransferase BioC [Klebsiella sp. BIGb0407]MCS3430908.1 malonyl-CoA O-methyltransferase [Klebsiella sp. BIGb0407]
MTQQVDKAAIAAAFSRAANHYEQFAELQRLTGDALLERVSSRRANGLLDAGCGTGWYSRVWQSRGSRVIALDLSASMLESCQQKQSAERFIEADIESIPLADKRVDLAWSNLALQWCSDIHQALSELYRVTKPGGCIAFTTLASGSLIELRQAWQAVDDRQPVNTFMTIEDIEQACRHWDSHLQCHPITQYFPDVISAMRSLKGVGATHLHHGRHQQLTTRSQLQRLASVWPQHQAGYPLSWQIISGVIERDE